MVPRVLVLEAGRAERHYWLDLWAYRELFLILAWRDVAVRYKQTVIGVGWAIVRPFLTMIILPSRDRGWRRPRFTGWVVTIADAWPVPLLRRAHLERTGP